jgi:cytoskeletal protein RodZ
MQDQRMTVGQVLRTERENRKVSLDSVAKGTRIKPAFLQALEEDAFRALPSEAYVRGFLQCYAKFIHLNPAEVLDQYRSQTEPEKNQMSERPSKTSPIHSVKNHLFDFLATIVGGTPAYSVSKSVLRQKD